VRKQYVATPETAVMRQCEAHYKDTLHTGYRIDAFFNGGSIPAGIGPRPFPDYQDTSDGELDAWGAKAISICKPDSKVANAAATLAELYHEGLPHLLGSAFWKSRTLSAKSAGGEYLNVEFGFKPLANDIAKFAYGVVYFDKVVRQMERDSGKVVRRRFNFPPIETTATTLWVDGTQPSLIPSSTICDTVFPNTNGRTYRTVTTVTRRWFSGAFTYFAPPSGAFGMLGQAKSILGLDLTPDMLWEITPWSWAVDWFSNAGSVISNYQSFVNDGLLMRYGYVMEHKTIMHTYYHVGPTGTCFGDAAYPATMQFVTETKRRRRANPFGFGLTMSGLSGRQKSILGALGLVRAK